MHKIRTANPYIGKENYYYFSSANIKGKFKFYIYC